MCINNCKTFLFLFVLIIYVWMFDVWGMHYYNVPSINITNCPCQIKTCQTDESKMCKMVSG
jgi:hypothetical protein